MTLGATVGSEGRSGAGWYGVERGRGGEVRVGVSVRAVP